MSKFSLLGCQGSCGCSFKLGQTIMSYVRVTIMFYYAVVVFISVCLDAVASIRLSPSFISGPDTGSLLGTFRSSISLSRSILKIPDVDFLKPAFFGCDIKMQRFSQMYEHYSDFWSKTQIYGKGYDRNTIFHSLPAILKAPSTSFEFREPFFYLRRTLGLYCGPCVANQHRVTYSAADNKSDFYTTPDGSESQEFYESADPFSDVEDVDTWAAAEVSTPVDNAASCVADCETPTISPGADDFGARAKYAIPDDYDWSKPTWANYQSDETPTLEDGPYARTRVALDYSYHCNYVRSRQKLQDEIVAWWVSQAKPAERPWILFTAGSMGSGKTTMLRALAEKGCVALRDMVKVDPT
mmetsp:Transcript_85589/g.228194  ORF Transcript_85589/g.228194 Transcript_85589/m.228194 type:complete len:354 (-) Transcript_85589:594-1655(-)